MSENAELLFANETFYHAFHGHDMEAMDALWARHGPVVCVHPGWQALMTRAAVMESWRGILSGPGAPSIACRTIASVSFPSASVRSSRLRSVPSSRRSLIANMRTCQPG